MRKKLAVLFSFIFLLVLIPSFGVKASEALPSEDSLEKTLISSVSVVI